MADTTTMAVAPPALSPGLAELVRVLDRLAPTGGPVGYEEIARGLSRASYKAAESRVARLRELHPGLWRWTIRAAPGGHSSDEGATPDEDEIDARAALERFRRLVAAAGGVTPGDRHFWRVGMFPGYDRVRYGDDTARPWYDYRRGLKERRALAVRGGGG